PGVAIQGDGTWDSPIYVASWDWAQAESRPQSAWQVELLDADGLRMELRGGSGAQTSATMTRRMVDGGEYTARVRAATGGVWSDWSPLDVVAEFVPPAPALVDGEWSESSGTVELTVEDGSDPEFPDAAPRADTLMIERAVN